jgi:hypothetical protein
MLEPADTAQEQIEQAREERRTTDPWSRWMAVTVSFLAACLALADLGARSSQTEYLTHNVSASDIWNAYQGKNLRANLWDSQAILLESLPNATDPAIRQRIKDAHAEEARMRDQPETDDGMKQLEQHARTQELERGRSFRAYHGFEHAASVLEISIVLASVSVVTRVRALGFAAGAMGLAACAYGLVVLALFA